MKEADAPPPSRELIDGELGIVRTLIGRDGGEIRFVDSGWTSRVYVCAGGRWVVKFPRTERVKREYARERQVLALLGGVQCPVELPRLCWTDADDRYLGYEGIVGRELAAHDYAITVADKARIGRLLGSFLKVLHGLTLPGARAVSVADEVAEIRQKYEMSQSVISRSFTAAERGRLDHLVNHELPRELRGLGEDPVLCHGDLGYWNMILRGDGGIGIIDFGDVGYHDRARDFMAMQDGEVLTAALDAYGEDARLRAKIAVRQKVLFLLDLPFFIGKRDAAGIQRTVQRIKAGL